jgi:hypothetical protein
VTVCLKNCAYSLQVREASLRRRLRLSRGSAEQRGAADAHFVGRARPLPARIWDDVAQMWRLTASKRGFGPCLLLSAARADPARVCVLEVCQRTT